MEDLDIRSEAVRDYLEQVPNSLIRWGSTVISIILVLTILLSWLIKYPILIRADLTLTTKVAPKSVVSKIDGRLLKVLVKDHQVVTYDQLLGVMESAAYYPEVLRLEEELKLVSDLFEVNKYDDLSKLEFKSYSQLGEVQVVYQGFRQQLAIFTVMIGKGYFDKQIQILKSDIEDLALTNKHLEMQHDLYARDVELAENEFKMNQRLFREQVIAKIDLDREESKVISKRIQLKGLDATLLNNNVLIRMKRKEIIELEKKLFEQKEDFLQSINTLRSAISAWKNLYTLRSPDSGEVVFAANLQEKENVALGANIFNVFATGTQYAGTLSMSQTNSGKVKIGQRVLIKFSSYPFEEYGMVEGRISTQPQLSIEGNSTLFAMVEFPDGLRTSQGNELKFNYGLTASAEIVTEDIRLIERIFYTIRGVFN